MIQQLDAQSAQSPPLFIPKEQSGRTTKGSFPTQILLMVG